HEIVIVCRGHGLLPRKRPRAEACAPGESAYTVSMRRVLIADDEESIRHVLTELLEERGYEVRAVIDGEEAMRELSARDYDALVTDVRMPKMNGLDLVRAAQTASPETTIIVMSAYGSHDLAIEAMKAGAYDYLGKPFRPDEVLLVLRKAEERERLRRENLILRREMSRRAPQLVAEGPAMKEVLRVVQKVAPAPTTVLIEGESGTGKELIARALHDLSPRAERPFVAVNCGAIPAPLIESELFGHTKGAFTDARTAKRGLFEEADGGTLLLDAVGEFPLAVQPALLRLLQQGRVGGGGDACSGRVVVRGLAASTRDCAARVRAGAFGGRGDRTRVAARGLAGAGAAGASARAARPRRSLREARAAPARGRPDPPRARAHPGQPHEGGGAARALAARAALQDPRIRVGVVAASEVGFDHLLQLVPVMKS